jgi:ABC-2 type transport system permease protein
MREFFPIISRVTRKEFRSFFSTPAAYLFIGAFLTLILFMFFWLETFFARNIADVRPLFEWLPLLLIFLVAALTMRSWAEERLAGTLESLLTAPVRPLELVLGKFFASLLLVSIALLLTLPLPVTVSLLGPLDWGPVIGGYVATIFLAAGYVAIGLYMSVRTDNSIVALILTSVVCGLFYLIGTETVTTLFGHEAGSWLALLGTGTRFESISRGVLDLRDLYYYCSIVGVFLTLNVFTLEQIRWAGNPVSPRHRQWAWLAGLTAANFIAGNLWLGSITHARIDMTQGNLYSLSQSTQQQLAQLREPLLIRGYFSAKTHPLLAPLVPRLKDLLKEYAVASGGRARVEIVDPTRDRGAEEEAASRYGIRPVPFQTADRYQAAVVSSYFDLVIAYGDQYEKLGFQDLIEVKAYSEGDLDVVLKDPEYAVTRAIRKVAGAYQAGGNVFDNLTRSVTFKGYVSSETRLPKALRELRADLEALLKELGKEAGERFTVRLVDPDTEGGQLAEELKEKYGFLPQIVSPLDPKPFWFYMILEADGEVVQVPLPTTLSKEELKRAVESALQRLTPGVLKTVVVMKLQLNSPSSQRYTELDKTLTDNVRIKEADLKDGRVPAEADLLLVLAPDQLDDKQRYAIDQFLMQGGSVIVTTSPFDVHITSTLAVTKKTSGLQEWLAHHGITIGETMVLDPHNAALPVPVERQLGGITVREIRMLPYPHFPDLRKEELSQNSPITASLGQLTLNWASPVTVDAEKNKGRTVTELVRSSAKSWTSGNQDVLPDYRTYPNTGFPVGDEQVGSLMAVAIEGRFDSFYQGKESPLTLKGDNVSSDKETAAQVTGVINHSPDSARLILVSSNTFASDMATELVSQGLSTRYTKPFAFIQNAVDWSLEDRSLLALRGRTQLARTLDPLPDGRQQLWESANYGLALMGLLMVWIWRRRVAVSDHKRYQQVLMEA